MSQDISMFQSEDEDTPETETVSWFSPTKLERLAEMRVVHSGSGFYGSYKWGQHYQWEDKDMLEDLGLANLPNELWNKFNNPNLYNQHNTDIQELVMDMGLLHYCMCEKIFEQNKIISSQNKVIDLLKNGMKSTNVMVTDDQKSNICIDSESKTNDFTGLAKECNYFFDPTDIFEYQCEAASVEGELEYLRESIPNEYEFTSEQQRVMNCLNAHGLVLECKKYEVDCLYRFIYNGTNV